MLESNTLTELPPESLMARVAGSADGSSFNSSGARTVDEWSRAIAAMGKTFHDFETIVDFGCGCGRALRHLVRQLQPSQKLIGVDVDREAIDWVARSHKDVKARQLGLRPPAPIESGTVDLVVSHSVFTHLPEDVQSEWLADLHRVLKPGALFIVSFHGRKVANEYKNYLLEAKRPEEADHFIRRYERYGFFYIQGRTEAELALPVYYGSAFHTVEYIEENWLRLFICRAWLPVFALNHQDVLLLQKQ